MNKSNSLLLISLLTLSAFLMIIPIAPVHGSTGSATLGYVNATPTPATFTPATNNESVVAGTSIVTAQDGLTVASGSIFAIDLSGVTFSGTQFKLYMSTNGFSNIGAGDLLFTPTSFNTASFGTYNCATACKAVTENIPGVGSSTFYIGYLGSNDLVIGPIDLQINSSYNFIKVYDGSTGAVAVTTGTLYPQPGITLSKTSGPAGTMVSASGGAFPSNTKIDLNATFAYRTWSGTSNKTYDKIWMSGVSTGPGYFSTSSIPMVDTMQSIDTVNSVFTGIWITIIAVNATTPGTILNGAENALGQPRFHESSRGIFEVYSYDSSGTLVDGSGAFAPNTLQGNDSGTTGSVGTLSVTNTPVVNAKISGTLGIEGNFSYIGKSVTFLVGGANAKVAESGAMATTSPVVAGSDGQWVANVTIPILGLGHHNVWVDMGGVYYNFTINVLPTMVITDSVTGGAYGPTSDPSSTITVSVYGFPANSVVWLYWQEYAFGDGNAYWLNPVTASGANATTGSNGQFITKVSFAVPHAYGVLPHVIYALPNTTAVADSYTFIGTDTYANIAALANIVSANFTVTPTLVVTPSSVSANDATSTGWATAIAEGLGPGCNSAGSTAGDTLGLSCETLNKQYIDDGINQGPSYAVGLDNAPMLTAVNPPTGSTSSIMANGTGDASIFFPTTGLRPGLHSIALYGGVTGGHIFIVGPGSLNYVLNNTYGPNVWATFAVTTSGDSIYAGFASLQATIDSLSSSVSSMQSSLASMSSDISTLTSDIATLTSNVGSLQTSVNSITGQLNTLASSVSSAASSASSAATAAQQAATAAQQAASNTSGVANTSTYVLVVAVLAAITLVLELAILVRKLS